MNAPAVNVCIWGCCRNVLFLRGHPEGVFSLHSLCPDLTPCLQPGEPEGLCWSEGCRGTSAVQWDGPCLYGRGDTGHKRTSAGAGMCPGLCLWAFPWYLLGFDPPHQPDPSARCQQRAALGQVVLRTSLLLIHFAHFILVLFLLGWNQAGTDVNRLVISC